MRGVRDSRPLIEAACGARDLEGYERAVLEHFERAIGYDVAMFSRRAPGLVTPGFDPPMLARFAELLPMFGKELSRFQDAAIASGGAGIDNDFFSVKELERTRYYQELMRPLGGRSTLIGYLFFRGAPVGSLILGRTGRGRFRDHDRLDLQAALPALAMADVAMHAAPRPRTNAALDSLTPREREIVGYLRLGYANREIALACGTSFRTVRNQLSAVYAKLGASNRTEALALVLDSTE